MYKYNCTLEQQKEIETFVKKLLRRAIIGTICLGSYDALKPDKYAMQSRLEILMEQEIF